MGYLKQLRRKSKIGQIKRDLKNKQKTSNKINQMVTRKKKKKTRLKDMEVSWGASRNPKIRIKRNEKVEQIPKAMKMQKIYQQPTKMKSMIYCRKEEAQK